MQDNHIHNLDNLRQFTISWLANSVGKHILQDTCRIELFHVTETFVLLRSIASFVSQTIALLDAGCYRPFGIGERAIEGS